MPPITFSFRILVTLLIIDLILIALHSWHVAHGLLVERYALQSYIHPFYAVLAAFNADGEGTVVAWFSSAQFLVAGLLCFLLARTVTGSARSRLIWIVLALLLIGLSADETASLHETSAGALMQLPEISAGLDWFVEGDGLKNSFAWVVIFAPLALLFLAFFAVSFYQQLRHYPYAQYGCLLGLLCFILVMLLEATVFFAPDVAHWQSSGFIYLYKIGTTLEELLELAGVSFVVFGLTNRLVGHSEHTVKTALTL